MYRQLAALAALLTLTFSTLATPARAHDYWLSAEPPAVAPGDALAIHMWVGEGLEPEEEKRFLADRTVSFVHVDASGSREVAARDDDRPLVSLTLDTPGGHLFALERNAAEIELDANKFTAYLEHEGLDHILAERVELGEHETAGRERYTRHLKVLVQSGDDHDDIHAARLGHELELSLLDDPARHAAGDELRVELRFQGQPLPGAKLRVLNERGGEVEGLGIETDAEGVALIPELDGGQWLIRTVHMVRCEGCEGIDWRSYWVGYSFFVPADAGPTNRAGAVTDATPPSSVARGCASCSVTGEGGAGPLAWGWIALASLALCRRRTR